MSLLPPTETRSARTPKPCFFAEHNGKAVLRRGEGVMGTPRLLICGETEADVNDEITRLGLTTMQTPTEAAAAFFAGQPDEVKKQFGPVFEAVSAVPALADKIKAVEAVTVPDAFAPLKAKLLEILRG